MTEQRFTVQLDSFVSVDTGRNTSGQSLIQERLYCCLCLLVFEGKLEQRLGEFTKFSRMSGKEAVREPVSDLLLYLFTDNVLYLVIWEGSSALMAITLVLFTSENLRFCLPVVILFIFILALSKRSITPCIYPMIVLLVSFFL